MSGILAATATYTPRGNPRGAIEQLGLILRVMSAVKRAQSRVAEHAKAIVPVNSGALQSSIDVTEPVDDYSQIVGQVVATAPHAAFVEFGTGLRGSGTYPGQLPQSGVPYTGSWIYDYRGRGWKGMVSQPYMRPALDAARSEVLEEFRR